MDVFELKNIKISLNRTGSNSYNKVSYPIRYGIYSEIETDDYIYQFNLNGEIKFIQSKKDRWPKDEWLKRTTGNDWVYYTPGIYTGIQSYIGEYYLPCFQYKSNSIFAFKPFENETVTSAIKSVELLIGKLKDLSYNNINDALRLFLNNVIDNGLERLSSKVKKFHKILGGVISVLPPDSRHVDYDIIPVIISRGCLYNCSFCMVKSGNDFFTFSKDEISRQIKKIKNYYGKDLSNYNSIFLGDHDGLAAGSELIEFTINEINKNFNFKESFMSGTNLYIFGSVDSFLNAEDSFFKYLNRTKFYTYINIGLESAHNDTLKTINKPVPLNFIKDAFNKMLDLNLKFDKIEVSVNFIIGGDLPDDHVKSIVDLTKDKLNRYYNKGCIYLSPVNTNGADIKLQRKFKEIKSLIPLPVYLYFIQRL